MLPGSHSGCKANVSKTRCTPLGKARHDIDLISCIKNKYGYDFIQNTFTALGVVFYNDKSIEEILCFNYESKLEKAKN